MGKIKKETSSVGYFQTNILDAMSNLIELSEKQQQRKKNLFSNIIEVHNSDSEEDQLLAVKRSLPYTLSDDEDYQLHANAFQNSKSIPLPQKTPKLTLAGNRSQGCSTPIKNHSESSFLSSINISNIKVEETVTSVLTNNVINLASDSTVRLKNDSTKINILGQIIVSPAKQIANNPLENSTLQISNNSSSNVSKIITRIENGSSINKTPTVSNNNLIPDKYTPSNISVGEQNDTFNANHEKAKLSNQNNPFDNTTISNVTNDSTPKSKKRDTIVKKQRNASTNNLGKNKIKSKNAKCSNKNTLLENTPIPIKCHKSVVKKKEKPKTHSIASSSSTILNNDNKCTIRENHFEDTTVAFSPENDTQKHCQSSTQVSKNTEKVHSSSVNLIATNLSQIQDVNNTCTKDIKKTKNKSLGTNTSDLVNNSKDKPVNLKQIKITQNEPISFVNEKNQQDKKSDENGNLSTNLRVLSSKVKTSNVCPESPGKKSPKKPKYAKNEKCGINTKYLDLLDELFSTLQKYRHFRNLLSDEKRVLNIFTSKEVDQNYKYVCLKLLTWKSQWYNIFKFCKQINLDLSPQDTIQLYYHLVDQGVVDTDFTGESLSYLLNLLNKHTIKSIYTTFKLPTVGDKHRLIQNLLKFCSTQRTLVSTKSSKDRLFEEISQKMGKCLRINKTFEDHFYNIYLLASFTNSAFSNIKDYFSSVFGVHIYFPTYTVEEYNVFYSRNEFLRFAEARKHQDDYENACQERNYIQALEVSKEIFEELVKLGNCTEDENRYKDAPHLKRYTAKSVYVRTLSKAAQRLLTKYHEHVQHWLIYMIGKIESSLLGDWYDLLAWIYMKYKQPPDSVHAAQLIIKVLTEHKDKLSELQVYKLQFKAKQLMDKRKYKLNQLLHDSIAEILPEELINFPTTTVDAKTLRGNDMGKKRNYVINDEHGNKTYMSVENIALDYYLTRCGYTDGKHCEGSLIHALFALFFWDIIYDPDPPVPGTFLSNIQHMPLDMTTPYFYSNRKDLIDKRLDKISHTWSRCDCLQYLKDRYFSNFGETGFVNVSSIINDAEAPILLENLVDCIGREILSKIFQRMLRNIGAYRSGMPDLLIWNLNSRKAKFVEVKGEGDKLQPNQELWLSYLQSIGADIEVCHVHSIGSKRKKPKSSNE